MVRRSSSRPSPRATDWLRLAIPVLLVAGLVVAAWRLGYFSLSQPGRLAHTAASITRAVWLPPAFIGVYVVCAAVAVPIAPMSYIAGALFGFAAGGAYVWVAALLGGAAGYWLARKAWREPAKRLLGRYDRKLEPLRRGGPFLATLRIQLVPIMPYGVCNYAAAALGLPFVPFIIATAIGVLPGTLAAVFVGHEVMIGMRGNDRTPIWIGIGVAAALIALSFVPSLVTRMRRLA